MNDLIPDRYELKYLIDADRQAAIEAAIAPFCVRDRNAAKQPSGSYVITSLYCDTSRADFYRAKEEKAFERLKLRVRTYGWKADGPVFLEVKRKYGDIVAKSRIRADAAQWSQQAQAPHAQDGDFFRTLDFWQARPVLLARYARTPFMSVVDAYARVTFDRQIVYQPWDDWSLLGKADAWRQTDSHEFTGGVRRGIVLELKCTQAVPRWMISLIRRFDLERTGYSKYCNGFERLQAEGRPDPRPLVARFGGRGKWRI